ncbi:MAG TPA: transposase [Mycobacterium sp.]
MKHFREGLMDGNSYEALERPLKGTLSERIEVRVERRRRWSVEQKLSVVRETLERGAVAKVVAERHGISTGLLYTWRKQMLTTAMAGFVPVEVAPEAPVPMLAAGADPPAEPAHGLDATAGGVIEVQWSSGVRVSVRGSVDVKLLRGVLAELGSH